MNFIFYLFLVLNIFAFIQAEIQTIKSFDESIEVLNQTNENSLVIFDVDRTLIVPEQNAFNNDYLKLILNALKTNYAKTNDYENYVKLYRLAINFKQILIEPNIVQIIKDLQDRQIKTIALSNMKTEPNNLIDWNKFRYDQLNGLDINFSSSFQEKIILKNLQGLNNFSPIFYKGIILTNRIEKGVVLIEFLKIIKCQPKEVIFFDDDLENLKSVEEKLKKLDAKIIFKGYYYIKADSLDASVDQAVFNAQVNHLIKYGYWLKPQELQSVFSYDEII